MKTFSIIYLVTNVIFSTEALSWDALIEEEQPPMYISKAGGVIVTSDGSHRYSEPRVEKIAASLRWMQVLSVDSERENKSPDGWIPINDDEWVRSEDVATGKNLRRVIGCWPIKQLNYEPGDYSMHIKFNLDGTGVADGIDDFPELRHVTEPSVQVYMEKSLVIIAYSQHDLRVPYILRAGYKADGQRLFPDGMPSHEQERFSKTELEGCANTPTLE